MKEKIIFMILILFNTSLFASTLTYTITNEKKQESTLILKDQKSDLSLSMYCDNVFNKIDISLNGINEKDFYKKNIFNSKIIFGKSFNKYQWKGSYNEKGDFNLKLDSNGFVFVKNFLISGKILIDMSELNGLKLFELKDKNYLNKYMNLSLENCGIYL